MPAGGAVQAVPSARAGQRPRPGRHRSRAIGVRANPPGLHASERPVRSSGPVTACPYRPGGLLAAKVVGDRRFGACPERSRRIPDMQGHVRQVTDVDGDAIAEYQYDAWGLIQLTAASAMAFGDWGYTWDGKPGRYYVQQRHLRADLGRWTSRDPVETEPPYAYVGNRPTWAADPSGEQGRRIVALPTEPKALAEALRQLSDAPPAYDPQRWANLTLAERARYLESRGVAGPWAWRTEAPSDKPRASIGLDWDRWFAIHLAEENRNALERLRDARMRPVPPAPVSNRTGKPVDKFANGVLTRRHSLQWLIDMVQPNGDWDFKNKDEYGKRLARMGVWTKQDRDLEEYGNYHYGYVCAAWGLPEKVALAEAGRVQRNQLAGLLKRHEPPKPSMGEPPAKVFLDLGGVAPYGDDPVDQYWISRGYQDYRRDRPKFDSWYKRHPEPRAFLAR